MLAKLVLLIVAFMTIMIVRYITDSDPIDLIAHHIGLFRDFLSGRSSKKSEEHRVKFNQMTAREKKKSMKYRSYSFLNEIMLDMGWSSKNITVEGVNTLIVTITYFVGGAIWILMDSFILAIIVAPVFYMTAIAFLFLISRINHTRRKQALMDAEDIICANMGQGVVVAIESNIDSFDPFVKAPFNQFLDEVYNRNASVEVALNNLNTNCGEQMDLFCDKARTFEKERRPGMENVFQYNINRNAEIRVLDRECAKTFTAMNRNYLLSLIIICGFVIYTAVTYEDVALFYGSALGKLFLTLYIVAAAIVFIYIQYIQSKPFRYGQKGLIPDTSAARSYEEATYNRTKQAEWLGDKLEPLAVRARKILLKNKKQVTEEDLRELEAYKEELKKARESEQGKEVENA